MPAPRFEVRDLDWRVGGPVAFTLADGGLLCIAGESGSGKTLLLRALADLDPHGGTVLLEGRACEDFSPPDWRRAVGYVPAESHWWADKVAAHFSHDCAATLERLGFARDVLDWSIARLSAGEKQRLALARALHMNPRVLLLDEATANLDLDNTLAVERLIASRREADGLAVVWVSHDGAQHERLAGASLRLAGGRLGPAPQGETP